mmetsp:Transcript_37077/g.118003  ORF Transcript_37077/g.118003 Transcript_37077/m.118003 type:complete len:378 (+) Transcript_37077:306-1439(+)
MALDIGIDPLNELDVDTELHDVQPRMSAWRSSSSGLASGAENSTAPTLGSSFWWSFWWPPMVVTTWWAKACRLLNRICLPPCSELSHWNTCSWVRSIGRIGRKVSGFGPCGKLGLLVEDDDTSRLKCLPKEPRRERRGSSSALAVVESFLDRLRSSCRLGVGGALDEEDATDRDVNRSCQDGRSANQFRSSSSSLQKGLTAPLAPSGLAGTVAATVVRLSLARGDRLPGGACGSIGTWSVIPVVGVAEIARCSGACIPSLGAGARPAKANAAISMLVQVSTALHEEDREGVLLSVIHGCSRACSASGLSSSFFRRSIKMKSLQQSLTCSKCKLMRKSTMHRTVLRSMDARFGPSNGIFAQSVKNRSEPALNTSTLRA